MSHDTQTILYLTAAACLTTGIVGALVLQAVRRRSLLVSIVVASLAPVAAVSAAVAINVNAMVISSHDSGVVTLALGIATALAVALSFLLGRRVASGSRELAQAVRDLAAPPAAEQAAAEAPEVHGSRGRSSAPAEITGLAAELAATRASLNASRDRERALEQSRRDLVAFMSHDLRTPLAGLRALAEGLEDDMIEDRAAALRQMRQTVDRMGGLVADLFELSRLHAGDATTAHLRAQVSLAEVALDVVGEAREAARRKHVELRLDVPDEGDPLAVQGNGDELARAVGNLVGNAVRHTHEGGTVVVSAQRSPDGRVCLHVTDGCGGIAVPDLDRVFEVGWRGQPERGVGDAGAGLGLAIAREVVVSHAGRISVDNVGDGCRFAVDLPPS